jgi:hyperosmotically inducible periplasmic protein
MSAIAQTGIQKLAMVSAGSFSDGPIFGNTPMQKHTEYLLLAAALVATIAVSGCNKPPEPVTTMPAVPVAAGNVSDIDVTEHVKTALHQNDLLKGFDISVETVKGDVRLMGLLDTQAQVDEALKIARAAEGAHAVHDELTLKK